MSMYLFDKLAAERGDGLLPELRALLQQRPVQTGVPVATRLDKMLLKIASPEAAIATSVPDKKTHVEAASDAEGQCSP